MSEESGRQNYLDAKQVIYLPSWARYSVMGILGLLAVAACLSALGFFLYPHYRDSVMPALAIAQTAAGGFAIVLFVLFAERQLSTDKLHLKTDEFLEKHIVESLSKIEVPQIIRGQTVKVEILKRASSVHGRRKDIYGANYDISLEQFHMRMWIGINVKRLSTIYFIKAESHADEERMREIFRFTFSGAETLGYKTNFEYAEIDNQKIISIWSTVMADNAILGNPAEQLFWVQDVAMMTQSFIRTAIRHGIDLNLDLEPGPL